MVQGSKAARRTATERGRTWSARPRSYATRWSYIRTASRRRVIALKDRYDALWQKMTDELQAEGVMPGDAQLARLFTFGVLNWVINLFGFVSIEFATRYPLASVVVVLDSATAARPGESARAFVTVTHSDPKHQANAVTKRATFVAASCKYAHFLDPA